MLLAATSSNLIPPGRFLYSGVSGRIPPGRFLCGASDNSGFS